MSETLYNDGRYMVSAAIVATPCRFYPLANTTAAVRRDPLWIAIGLAFFSAAGVLTYGDLLYPIEIAVMAGGSAMAIVAGWQVVILRLDAPGHPRTMIVSNRKRIWKIFHAIRSARTALPDKEVALITHE